MIAVTLGGTTRMIRRDEVRYVQAQGDYARLHTEEASYLVRVPMSDLERQWADAFVRIHRSYLVAIGHLTPHPARRRPPDRRGRRGRAAGEPAAAARPARAARGGDHPAAVMSDDGAEPWSRRRRSRRAGRDRGRRRVAAAAARPAQPPPRVRVTAPRAGSAAASARPTAHGRGGADERHRGGLRALAHPVAAAARDRVRGGLRGGDGALRARDRGRAPARRRRSCSACRCRGCCSASASTRSRSPCGALYVRAASRNEARYRSLTEEE